MSDTGGIPRFPAAHALSREHDNRDNDGIIALCTANICRSPMAAALLSRRLAALGVSVAVRSAGMLSSGDPPCPEVVSVMAWRGVDIASHRSHLAQADDLARAGLVLAMARDNLRQAVIVEPGVWPRAFTLKELVRRGDQIGPRRPGEPLRGWLSRAHAGRERLSLLGDSAEDDVADPIGGPLGAYEETADLLDLLVTRLAELGWSHAGTLP